MLLSNLHFWIKLLLDMLKSLRGNAKLFPSWTQGWALKSSASHRCRFTYKQKKYLTEKFQQGERSGRKSDPASAAPSMMSAMDSQDKRMFSSEEFLTASRVAGFFFRLAAKKSLFNVDDLEEEIECATQEASIQELTSEVSLELLQGHPIK